MLKKIFCVCLVLLSEHTLADNLADYKKLLSDSFTSFEQYDRNQWAYSLNKIIGSGKKKITMLESFDPSKPRPQRWTLLKEYDKAPSDNRLAEYLDIKKREMAAQEQNGAAKTQNLQTMVAMETLSVVSKKANLVSLSFSPILPDMKKDALEMLTGLIVLDTKNNHVVSLQISNIGEVSPAAQVKLSFFSMAFRFVQMNKVLLPKNISIDIKGMLAGKQPITQSSSETYSDYRFIGDQN